MGPVPRRYLVESNEVHVLCAHTPAEAARARNAQREPDGVPLDSPPSRLPAGDVLALHAGEECWERVEFVLQAGSDPDRVALVEKHRHSCVDRQTFVSKVHFLDLDDACRAPKPRPGHRGE